MCLGPLGADWDRRAWRIARRGDHRVDQIGRGQLADQGWIVIDLLAQQTVGDFGSLLDSHDHVGPSEIVVGQVITEGVLHVAVGERPGVSRVLMQGHAIGVQTGLAVPGREDPPHPHERSGVVGQHHPLELARGGAIVDRRVPVVAAVEGGGMDEEHVHRPRGLTLGLADGIERPGRGQAVVRGRGEIVGLERLTGVEPCLHDVFPGHGQDQAEHHQDSRARDHTAALEARQAAQP